MRTELSSALVLSLLIGGCSSNVNLDGGGGSGGSGASTEGGGGQISPQGGASDGGGTPGTCGNGALDAGEQCDGSLLGGQTCVTLGFDGGELSCSDSCVLDTSGCSFGTCGNGVLDPDEDCDGTDFGGATCESLGLPSGALACADTCAFDTSQCTGDSCAAVVTLPDPSNDVAGDTTGHADSIDDLCLTTAGGGPEIVYSFTPSETGLIDVTLVSPGVDLSLSLRSTCAQSASEIACKDDAFPNSATNPDTERLLVQGQAGTPVFIVVEGYDASGAGPFTLSAESRQMVCGDGNVDAPAELCDGANVGGATCADAGFASGTLTCAPGCTAFDTSGCTGCAHSACLQGEPLASTCDPCVAQICAAHPNCCTGAWDASCTSVVNTTCGAGTCSICGDAFISMGEHCDGANFGTRTCVTEGFAGGNLACDACSLSADGCTLPASFNETEPNGSAATANAYQGATNGTISPPMGPNKDQDWFAVTAQSGQLIKATLQDQGAPHPLCHMNQIDSDIAIYASDGTTQLEFNDDISGANNWCSSASVVAPTTGTYYVRVRASQQFAPNSSFPYVVVVTVN